MRRSRMSTNAMRARGIVAGLALAIVVLEGFGVGFGIRAGFADDRPAAASRTERNAVARKWFQDARFGLSVHWGVYSLLGKGEWVMHDDKLPISEYAKLPPRFNPTRFDAEAWVKLARAAGARYITVTAKDHDGFCMFNTKRTDYDIVDATPYHKDPLKALADACHDQGIKLFLDYSLLDWHHPSYDSLGKTGNTATAGPEARREWKRYIAYYQGQVRELCTNYGEIGGICFNGGWDRPEADWDLAGTYQMIHDLQPAALVGNHRHEAPISGEDFQIAKPDRTDANASGFHEAGVADDFPRQTWLTINDSWGYCASDTHYKSPEQLIRALVAAAGRGANLLLNVGAHPDGSIDPESRDRLGEVGKWLATYGDSIYGTRRGPFPPQDWGVSTAKGSSDRPTAIFLHVLEPRVGMPIIFHGATSSWTPYLFGKDRPLKLSPSRTPPGMALDLPESETSPIDTIVTLRPLILGR